MCHRRTGRILVSVDHPKARNIEYRYHRRGKNLRQLGKQVKRYRQDSENELHLVVTELQRSSSGSVDVQSRVPRTDQRFKQCPRTGYDQLRVDQNTRHGNCVVGILRHHRYKGGGGPPGGRGRLITRRVGRVRVSTTLNRSSPPPLGRTLVVHRTIRLWGWVGSGSKVPPPSRLEMVCDSTTKSRSPQSS